jgi:hypothetical protein
MQAESTMKTVSFIIRPAVVIAILVMFACFDCVAAGLTKSSVADSAKKRELREVMKQISGVANQEYRDEIADKTIATNQTFQSTGCSIQTRLASSSGGYITTDNYSFTLSDIGTVEEHPNGKSIILKTMNAKKTVEHYTEFRNKKNYIENKTTYQDYADIRAKDAVRLKELLQKAVGFCTEK